MNHRGGMMRNLTGEAHINDGKCPWHYLRVPASSCPDLCKYGKKYDSLLAKKNGVVPTHLTSPKTPDENCIPKKVGTRHKGEECGLETAFKTDEKFNYCSGVNNMAQLWHLDASSDLIECMSEEYVNMKPRTLLPFLKNIMSFGQNNSFLEDESLESALMAHDGPSTSDENTISIDDVPLAYSDGSEGSAVMELESPLSAAERMASTLISLDHNLEGSSMEFKVTPPKMMSIAAGELINQGKESSHRSRNMKQETKRNSLTSSMASSSEDTAGMKPKEQKQVNGLKVDEKQKREIPMLRSSLPVKTSLLGRVKAKKKVDTVLEPSITNEKSPTLSETVETVEPKQAGVIPYQGLCKSLSPIIFKKKTMSPPKKIQPKTKSSVVKYRSLVLDIERITGQSSQESCRIAGNAGMSKLGEMKISKQFAASQAPKSNVNLAVGLNNSKLRSLKKRVEAGIVDEVKEKTPHVEQKLVGVALKSAEQKQMKMKSQQSSRTLSSSSSISSSAFFSSTYGEQSDGSQLKVSDVSGSKKSHIGERKGRTPLHIVEQKLVGVALKSAEQKLRFQQSSGTLSSRSSMSSSASVSSGYKKESGGSRLTIRDASESKKTHFSEREGRTSLHIDEQKLFGVAVMSAEQKHAKLRSQLSSRTSSSRSSISSSISSSAFGSSNYEENDESQWISNNASGSKKTPIGEGNRKTPLYSKKKDYKKLQKRTANVSVEDKLSSFENVSYRRGKEVSPQRVIPEQRRLTFTQDKTVSEAENFEGEIGVSSFSGSRESTTTCLGTVSPGSPTVVLRPQDVQEKNSRALFNDVIEETANKLVETRKSKVKALVCAFERDKKNKRKQQELLFRHKFSGTVYL